MELFQASKQWAARPDDERFESVQAMYEATKAYAYRASHKTVSINAFKAFESESGDVCLQGPQQAAMLTHYAFGQLSRWAGAPPSYLRTLPAGLAADCINEGLAKAEDRNLKFLFHSNPDEILVTRAITSESYDRVWNYEIMARVQNRLVPEGWRVPPARPARAGQRGTRIATAADILPNQKEFGLAIKVGDSIAPAGLYASDHDMFAFLVDFNDPIWDGKKFLNRGVFIQNSEVGDCALRFKLFTLDNVCGNHIVWGADNIVDVVVRHVKGEGRERGNTLNNAFAKWNVMSNSLPSGSVLSSQIQAAKQREIAGSKEDVLDACFAFARKKSLNRLTRSVLEQGYAIAEEKYENPRSVWGMVNGLTEVSQTTHADVRTELDEQAGKLMEAAF